MRAAILLLVLSLAACVAGPAQQVPRDSTGTAISWERPPAAIGPETALPQAQQADASGIASPTRMPTTTSTSSDLSHPDYSCKTSADCAVKDVGNCCGQYPACVNKDSRTFPAQVRAQCSKEHRMGVCGFPAIHGCECVAGRCEGQTGMKSNSQIVN